MQIIEKSSKTPFFTISLDLELLWGVFPLMGSVQYGANILGGRRAVPLILSLFKEYGIHATWAMVAMASFETKKEMQSFFPEVKPEYNNRNVDPYAYLNNVGETEREDPLHFGYSLLRQITEVAGMEVASHTFSHFYCLERHEHGAFKADLNASNEAFGRLNIDTKSLIFCRNQYREKHLEIARDMGFIVYRGNEEHYLYKPRQKHALPIRAFRLADAYVDISGNHLSMPQISHNGLVNVPASRFLRPASKNKLLERLQLNRIKNAMHTAAKNGNGFHLWWHPHNFGGDLSRNIKLLIEILSYYRFLNSEYGMVSLNMLEVSRLK